MLYNSRESFFLRAVLFWLPPYLYPLQLIQYFQVEAERTLAHYVTYCHVLEKEPDTP